jgi:hypothetical protein
MSSNSGVATRHSHTNVCPIFGPSRELSVNTLPTYEDVLLSCFEERKRLMLLSDTKFKVKFPPIAESVAIQVENLFMKASIPTVTHTRVVQMVTSYHEVYYKIRKSFNRDKDKDFFKKRLEIFITNARGKLFDIAACKCEIMLSCACEKKLSCDCPVVQVCNCEKAKKIPPIELKFVYDQRTTRTMIIGSVDKKVSVILQKREERKIHLLQQETCSLDTSASSTCDTYVRQSVDQESNCDMSLSLPSTSQMRYKLTTTAMISDRYGVSDRATAAIVSSVMHDLGLICDSDMSQVIDRSKIRREKEKLRKEVTIDNQDQLKEVKGIYFDGRKDNTQTREKLGAKFYRRVTKEEHISIISEPGGQYVGHVTPKKGTGIEIAQCIIDFMRERDYDVKEVEAVGCDGTATNTGWKNGVIRNIEVMCKRPLQWFVCLLHFNELPYRHLFEHLDGTTTGPASFSGPIGKQLVNCAKNDVVPFEVIVPEFEIIITKSDLSKDQQYLLDIVKSVTTGLCEPDLAAKDPGPLSHSRWLTCANRVLRLYISEVSPSNELKILANYIVKTYAHAWFAIKKHHTVKDGPKHVLKVVQTTRHLPDDIKKIIDPVIERNGFICHPENLLLTMILDEQEHIRELGYRRIIKARNQKQETGESVRIFKVPSINFDAKDYTELIDWSKCALTSPPLLARMTTEHIESLLKEKALPKFDCLKFPCHTQSVERCVKLVTEASGKVCGHENRDGYIRATLKSRSMMPKFNTKLEFKGGK